MAFGVTALADHSAELCFRSASAAKPVACRFMHKLIIHITAGFGKESSDLTHLQFLHAHAWHELKNPL
jgi:hypothetical protein